MNNHLAHSGQSLRALVTEIQSNLVEPSISLSTILRKSQILAYKLGSDELKNWVRREQEGYSETDLENLPEYRKIPTYSLGTIRDRSELVNNSPIPTFGLPGDLKHFAENADFYNGVRELEGFAEAEGGELIKLTWPPNAVVLLNTYLQPRGYVCMEAFRSVSKSTISQILETIRNNLLLFLLELEVIGEYTEEGMIEVSPQEVTRVFNQYVFHQGASMSKFDQRGQQVGYQYNAAGDININNVSSVNELPAELTKLRKELSRAKAMGLLEEDTAIEAEYHLTQAVKEAEMPSPDKGKVLSHLGTATKVIGAIKVLSEMAKDIDGLIELVQGWI